MPTEHFSAQNLGGILGKITVKVASFTAICGFLYIVKYTFPVKEIHKYSKCVYYVVVTMSEEKKPNLLIRNIRQHLIAAEHHLGKKAFNVALDSFSGIKDAAMYAEDILKSIIFQESNQDLVHKPTLDRLAKWIEKYKESRNGDLIINGVLDVVLEQMELMKDAK